MSTDVASSRVEASRLVDNATTYFLMMPDQFEANVALAYLAKKYPNTKARKVTELRVDRITDVHHVIVLVRPKPSPGATPRRNQLGLIEYEHHTPESKLDEVRESKPIAGKNFWRPVTTEWEGADGEIDTPSFLQAVAQAASPITIDWHPEQNPGRLRLSWV